MQGLSYSITDSLTQPKTLMEVYMWVAFFKEFWGSALDNLGSVLDQIAAEEEDNTP